MLIIVSNTIPPIFLPFLGNKANIPNKDKIYIILLCIVFISIFSFIHTVL